MQNLCESLLRRSLYTNLYTSHRQQIKIQYKEASSFVHSTQTPTNMHATCCDVLRLYTETDLVITAALERGRGILSPVSSSAAKKLKVSSYGLR